MNPNDLISHAEYLLQTGDSHRLRQLHLKRAISSIYYALFHELAAQCANGLVGADKSARSEPAWVQVYRSPKHSVCRDKMSKPIMDKFPVEIRKFANIFRDLQQKREDADYNPLSAFVKNDVAESIEQVKDAIATLEKFSAEDRKDLRAFAIYLLLDKR